MKCAICFQPITFSTGKDGDSVAQVQCYESLCETHARSMIETPALVGVLTVGGEVMLAVLEQIAQVASIAVEMERMRAARRIAK